MNAACRAELLAPAAAPEPAGGRPLGEPEVVPPLPARAGRVTPWVFRHCVSAVRLAALAVEAVVVDVLVVELLPHAARAMLAVSAASTGVIRRARRVGLLWEFMVGL